MLAGWLHGTSGEAAGGAHEVVPGRVVTQASDIEPVNSPPAHRTTLRIRPTLPPSDRVYTPA